MIQLLKRDPPQRTMKLASVSSNMKSRGGWVYQDGGRWWHAGGVIFISCPTCGLSVFVRDTDDEGEVFVNCPFTGCGFFGIVKLMGPKQRPARRHSR